MRWIARLAWIALVLPVSSCCRPTTLPEFALDPFDCPIPLEAECEDVTAAGSVEITVDGSGRVNRPCVKVDWKVNSLEWKAAAGTDLVELKVLFKDRSRTSPPPDPLCGGARCVLPEPAAPPGRPYCYAVLYRIRGERELRAVDPKLIIKH